MPLLTLLQAGFNAGARMSVRELRKTETTDIIMLYSGTMQSVLAVIAYVIVPHSFAVPQHIWQAVTLVLTGTVVTIDTARHNIMHLAFECPNCVLAALLNADRTLRHSCISVTS